MYISGIMLAQRTNITLEPYTAHSGLVRYACSTY